MISMYIYSVGKSKKLLIALKTHGLDLPNYDLYEIFF